MDQQELRKLENQCIQEQPPWCEAACPLHVDVRNFMRCAAAGDWYGAWNVLHRTMPFPGILGRICDAPCRDKCKRSEAGDPIQVGMLERFCVTLTQPHRRIQPLPAKNKSVAVIGTCIASMTAAWDLIRKGWRVDVLGVKTSPGTSLLEKYADALTPEIVDHELSVLEKIGVRFYGDQNVHHENFIEKRLSEFDAVFLSMEIGDLDCKGLEKTSDGPPIVSSPLQATSVEGLFAGGGSASPVFNAAEGRWAATSIDRFLQNVSLTAGREKDGPYETRLYTSLEKIKPMPAVMGSGPDGAYAMDEAVAEASRCLRCECLECVKVCPYLEKFKGYPKKYAREIYNNESIVMGARQANKLINSCSLCGLCEVVCPENFAMPDLCLQTRQSMVRRGKMPPSAHEFALQDMEFSNSDKFFLAGNEPGKKNSDYVFFPGCQLAATKPDQTVNVYNHLRNNSKNGVSLMLGCCGAPAHWSGREDLFKGELERFRENLEKLGGPTVITACSSCQFVLSRYLPDISVVSLWKILNEKARLEPRFKPNGPLAVLDPCTARDAKDVQDAVRNILDDAKTQYEELELGREKTECCGFGGLLQNANPDLAREIVRRRAAQSERDYLTYCAMCRDSLAATGKRVIHILDLFFPSGPDDPATAPGVGWSDRRENRIRLKEKLLKEIWGEGLDLMEEHQSIKLIVKPEIRELLERRRILFEDVQQVIHHVQKTGDCLINQDTGRHKASFKPRNVVFWVEYTPAGDGYEIHNAYTHRMDVVGGGRL